MTETIQKAYKRNSQQRHYNTEQDERHQMSMRVSPQVSKAARVAQITPIKGNFKLPPTKFNFNLDADEREIIAKGSDVDKEEIWDMLEKKRFQELQNAAIAMQSELLVQQRCPKCTLIPPCKHYTSPDQVTNDAPRYIHSSRFKQVIAPAKRENLLQIIKHQSQIMHGQSTDSQPMSQNDQYDTGTNFNRVDRYGDSIYKSTLPQQMKPENDPLYQSMQAQQRKKMPQNRLEPLPVKHTEFLRRGRGNGGSPTNFEVKKTILDEQGSVQLQPINRRHQSVTIRVRGKDGGYAYTKGSIQNSHGQQSNSQEMSPNRRQQMEREKTIKEQIAAYREIKFEKERQKMEELEKQAQVEQMRQEDAIRRRQKYLDEQKRKIQECQIEKIYSESQAALGEEKKLRVRARQHIVEQQRLNNKFMLNKAYEKYKHDKYRAEEMLLVHPSIQQQQMNRTIKEEDGQFDGPDNTSGGYVQTPEIEKNTQPQKSQKSFTRNNYKIAGKSEGETEDDGNSMLSQSDVHNRDSREDRKVHTTNQVKEHNPIVKHPDNMESSVNQIVKSLSVKKPPFTGNKDGIKIRDGGDELQEMDSSSKGQAVGQAVSVSRQNKKASPPQSKDQYSEDSLVLDEDQIQL